MLIEDAANGVAGHRGIFGKRYTVLYAPDQRYRGFLFVRIPAKALTETGMW